jgi:hypothetical protein
MSSYGIIGSLYRSASGRLEGWCLSLERPDDRLIVEILVNDVVVSAAVAARFRSELRHAGKSDGHHGFSVAVSLPDENSEGTVIVEAREQATGTVFGRILLEAAGIEPAIRSRLDRVQSAVDGYEGFAELRPVSGAMRNALWRLGLQLRTGPQSSRGTALGVIREELRRLPRRKLRTSSFPAVSIILPSAETFEETLDAVLALASLLAEIEAEILLVDDGRDPRLTLIQGVVCGLRYLREPGANQAQTANLGALLARGSLLLFLGPQPGSSMECLAPLLSNGRAAVHVGLEIMERAVHAGAAWAMGDRRLGRGGPIRLCVSKAVFQEAAGLDEAIEDGSGLSWLDFLMKVHLLGLPVTFWDTPWKEAVDHDAFLRSEERNFPFENERI